ncbi:SH3 domain-containing protein [Novosphingobium sp. B-7]|uniref:SH3 domain-containing protein n=1 Tax=Novosphingobium sp. B-7 TaxID=1298855 RepID=UPI0003B647D1|nr:SH3 domain-containing protein [Novosphingobium sp. B-7]
MSAESDLALVVSPAVAPEGELALSGPSAKVDPLRLPVRGDLAHVRLAGRVFVPHYAVPMPHRVVAETALLKAGRSDAEAIAQLPAGESFAVLDMAGGWAWGQASDEGGLVGYVPLSALELVA